MSRLFGFALFLSIALLIFGSAHYYVWARLVRDPAWPGLWAKLATAVVVVMMFSVPATAIVSRILRFEFPHWLVFSAFTWMGVMFFLLVLAAVGDLTRLFMRAGGLFLNDSWLLTDPARRLALSRILGGGALFGAGLLGLISVRSGLASPMVQRVRVQLARWPKALDGYTIVQLTDLHLGPTLRRPFIADIVKRTNEIGPDLIVITGDLVDETVDELKDVVACLAQLRARHGVYFVTGNHEYYVGAAPWVEEIRRLSIHVLQNERLTIGEADEAFDLAGVNDLAGRQFGANHGPDLAATLRDRNPDRPLILLAHRPRIVHEAARMGVDLQLSGHTHAGQIWPFCYLVYLTEPYIEGLHQHGPTQIYVSRGTGYWGPPMRFLKPSEITHLRLESAPA
jgi:predicted MPP superfamily phosphohydrolase